MNTPPLLPAHIRTALAIDLSDEARALALQRARDAFDALTAHALAGSRAAQDVLDDIEEAETLDDYRALLLTCLRSLERLTLPPWRLQRLRDDDGALHAAWSLGASYAQQIARSAGVQL